jgi:hypothetical protein
MAGGKHLHLWTARTKDGSDKSYEAPGREIGSNLLVEIFNSRR